MSKVENIFLIANSKNKKISYQKKENFLINLITSSKNFKKLISLFKDMNITQKELNNLLDKTNSIEIKEKIKILINNLKEENISNFSILQNIINKSISNNVLEKKVNNSPPLKKEIVKITKQIIDSKIKLNKIILNEKEIKKFRQIKTFKDLIEFANEKNLNISKIIASSFKPKIDKNNNITLSTINILNNKIGNQHINILNKNNNAKLHQSTSISLKTLISLGDQNSKKYISKNNNIQENSNNIFSTNQTLLDNLKLNIIKAKETIKHFSNNLKKAIENYKPPISKISIELNPKELGKVEVTLVHRGDNLQVQINSNNNVISLFNYNQQELRQNLINMGFNDVNMSFNQQKQQQKEYQQNQKLKQKDDDELIIEVPYKYA